MNVGRGLALAAALLAAGPAASQTAAQTGATVAVVQQAVLAADGRSIVLNVGQPVALGDTVATGAGGEAQILFPDETRIVVGPNSQLSITRLLFRESGAARRLSVNAVRGTFRFLSGSSPPGAYAIRTPTATMGVRGTAFDFAVAGRDSTDLLVHSGEVELCARGRCARVPGGCQAVTLDRRGGFAQPRTALERRRTLDARFPYALDQSRLQPAFRTGTEACGDGAVPPPAQLVRQISLPGGQRAEDEGAPGRPDGPPPAPGGEAPAPAPEAPAPEAPPSGNPAD